jgi:hypothetical protein
MATTSASTTYFILADKEFVRGRRLGKPRRGRRKPVYVETIRSKWMIGKGLMPIR